MTDGQACEAKTVVVTPSFKFSTSHVDCSKALLLAMYAVSRSVNKDASVIGLYNGWTVYQNKQREFRGERKRESEREKREKRQRRKERERVDEIPTLRQTHPRLSL